MFWYHFCSILYFLISKLAALNAREQAEIKVKVEELKTKLKKVKGKLAGANKKIKERDELSVCGRERHGGLWR